MSAKAEEGSEKAIIVETRQTAKGVTSDALASWAHR